MTAEHCITKFRECVEVGEYVSAIRVWAGLTGKLSSGAAEPSDRKLIVAVHAAIRVELVNLIDAARKPQNAPQQYDRSGLDLLKVAIETGDYSETSPSKKD